MKWAFETLPEGALPPVCPILPGHLRYLLQAQVADLTHVPHAHILEKAINQSISIHISWNRSYVHATY